jgi:LacI family transcriptional regulator
VKKTTYKEIAARLNVSVRTVYRVVHNDAGVKKSTCRRVIAELNKSGYSLQYTSGCEKIVIDVPDNMYFQSRSIELMQRLPDSKFQITVADHRREKRRFLDLVAKADMVVFCSAPERDIIDKVRRRNPELLRINMFSSSGAGDITIESNNHEGGRLAAKHLYRHGHRHVLVVCKSVHESQRERLRGFMEWYHIDHPGEGKIDVLGIENGSAAVHLQIAERLQQYDTMPTAVFATCGYYGYQALNTVRSLNLNVPQNISIMSYDDPQNVGIEQAPELDTVLIYPKDILDVTVFYILNRPLLPRDLELHTNTRLNLHTHGSVRTVPKQEVLR